jgi:hypothetical protein
MIHELRIYRCVPGRKPALLSRFENETLRIWEKHGIRQVGFWTTLIGKSSQEITYMLGWDSMAEREKRWSAFLAYPEWVVVVAKTEKDGQLVENISSQLLAPAVFSAVKSLLRRLREGWRETELLHNGKRVRHDGVFEDFAVSNGVDVDRHPLEAIARAGTSEELPARRSTSTTLSPSATTSSTSARASGIA